MMRLMSMSPALPVVLLALALAACGTGTEVEASRSGPTPEAETPSTAASTTPSPSSACADGTEPAALPSPPPAAAPQASSSTTNQVDLNIYADCKSVRVGQPVRLRIIASGSQHEPSVSGIRIEGMNSASVPGCAQNDPNEQPSPAVLVQDMEHTYKKPGQDRIVVNAGTFCSRFSGFDRAELVLNVRP